MKTQIAVHKNGFECCKISRTLFIRGGWNMAMYKGVAYKVWRRASDHEQYISLGIGFCDKVGV